MLQMAVLLLCRITITLISKLYGPIELLQSCSNAITQIMKLAAEPQIQNFQHARPTDLVIPIMGPPGVGKSTFVNSLCAREVVEVGQGLNSCTKVLKPVILLPTEGPFAGHRLVIVDTPPFNSTNIPDSVILMRITDWLAASYKQDMKLAGVIYLFEATQMPTSIENKRDRQIFQKLCGDEALSMVVVGTTKFELLKDQATQEKRVQELNDVFWDKPAGKKSRICDVQRTQDSAWNVINQLAQGRTILQIQRELVDFRKDITETEAGKHVHLNKPKPGGLSPVQRVLRMVLFGRNR